MIDSSALIQSLLSSRHFSRSEPAQLAAFLESCQEVTFEQGQVILDEGVENEWIYLIVEGRAQVYSNGEPILILARRCELIGEMSVIANDVTAAQVIALTDLQALRFSEKQIRLNGDPELIQILERAFLSILTDKLRRTTSKAERYEGAKKALTQSEVQRVHVQQDLETQQEVLSSVLSSISEGVVVIEPSQDVLHTNPGFLKIVGQTEIPDNLADWPVALGLHCSDQKTLLRIDQLPMAKALKGVMVQNEEIFIKNPQVPEGRWVLVNSRALKPVDSEHISAGAVVMWHDYTTKKLAEAALVRAKNLAEEEIKAKENFLSMITHEMGTPLNSVIGLTDLLLASELPSGVHDSLQTIKGSSESLLTVIRNLLEYQQLQSEKAILNPERVDVNLLLAEMIRTIGLMAKEQGLHLGADFRGDFGWVSIDRKRLSLIMINLLHNAIKFTPQGTITLGAEQQGEQLHFWVKDTGVGMEAEEQACLFKPFSQAKSGLSRKYPGLGIGLILCQKLAGLLGGSIHLESEVGKGTTAHLTLPMQKVEPSPAPAKAAPGKTDFAKAYPYRILIAEDNKANASLITKVLSRLGYESTWVINGRLAWERAVEQEFDLILMDIQMPEMDGLEATQRIMEQLQEKAPLIVALTANSEDSIRKKCEELKMVGYLTKPLRVPQLTELLSSLSSSKTQ